MARDGGTVRSGNQEGSLWAQHSGPGEGGELGLCRV